jgi:hypothetical protein
VTDGTYLWVVNDSRTDMVYKYTLSGSLVGSWSITGAGSSPTGITLDPSNVGALWIVDSGTDRVYQFDNAAGRTSGSQSPSTSFALAAGNTNPQGIADPPPGAVVSTPPTRKKGHGGSAANGQAFSATGDAAASTVLIPWTDDGDDLSAIAAEWLRSATGRARKPS